MTVYKHTLSNQNEEVQMFESGLSLSNITSPPESVQMMNLLSQLLGLISHALIYESSTRPWNNPESWKWRKLIELSNSQNSSSNNKPFLPIFLGWLHESCFSIQLWCTSFVSEEYQVIAKLYKWFAQKKKCIEKLHYKEKIKQNHMPYEVISV